MKVKKPVLENPVYCDILYAIGDQEITLTELNDSFKKAFQVLWRQLEYLSNEESFKKKDKSSPAYMRDKEPFLNKEGIAENNKQLYSINWPKFIDCLMSMVKHKHKRYTVLRIERTEFKLLKNERFLRDIRHNRYLIALFKGFVLSCKPRENLLLIDFFNEIFNYPPMLLLPYRNLDIAIQNRLNTSLSKSTKGLSAKKIYDQEEKKFQELYARLPKIMESIESNDRELKDYLDFAKLIDIVSVRPELYWKIGFIQKEVSKEILRNVPKEVKELLGGKAPK